MSDVTVVVLTKNEEKNIAAVVQNAKKVAAEVLIVDSGSTDKTSGGEWRKSCLPCLG